MAFPEEARGMLDRIVDTPDAAEAFGAGYRVGLLADRRISFGSTEGILHAAVKVEDLSDSTAWADGRELPTDGDTVIIDDPAFVLGATFFGLQVCREQMNEAMETK
jgi:hypothetical protein